MSGDLKIVRIGSGGDGVAETDAGPVFVPQALPGERYARDGDRFRRIGDAAHDRATPPCLHFGTCGGCVTQHMGAETYIGWKRGLVDGAFKVQGIVLPDYELLQVGPGRRRRAVLTASDTGRGIVLGFHGARSHSLIDLEMCPVLMQELVEVLPGLRTLAGMLFAARAKAGKRGKGDDLRISLASLSGAIDVSVDGVRAALDAGNRRDAATLAERHGLQRISVDGEEIVTRDAPRLKTSGGDIVPQPGGFFQAVEMAEQRMAETVTAGVGKAKRVADLFAGIGTFSLPLARKAKVEAIDSEADALAALAASARMAHGLKPITTRVRDLFKEPLSLMELRDFDAVVLDPPRAGAMMQAEVLAQSPVTRVVLVSCHPATLARDMRILLDGGYEMETFVAIDQFYWTAHVEAVAVMVRRKKR